LKKIQAEKAEKQQALYGNPMAATFTPGTLDPNA
jgi:hypothetical protein